MFRRGLLVLFLVSLSHAEPLYTNKEIAKPRANPTVNYRLPSNIEPVTYTLRLKPNFVSDKFSGSVEIKIKVKETTKKIVLHKYELDIDEDSISITHSVDTTKETKIESAVDSGLADQNFYVITCTTDLLIDNEYILKISSFNGILNKDKNGFYLAEYENEQGVKRKFATTQFESTSARRAFPCFDEPHLKATFKIFITRPNGYNSISNAPLFKSNPLSGGKLTEDEFAVTEKPMSTYLVAFIVSDMALSATVDKHRVLARPQAIIDGLSTYALTTGDKVLKAMEEFVNVTYGFTKMDQAAIPDNYFSAGAMENWGLVTYKETYLLKSDKTTTTRMHQQIGTIIAHEFGHQWFGNLVTPTWWEYIWLNEGFATYFEHRAADMAEPTWRIMDQFLVRTVQHVFAADSLPSTRAMNHAVGSPSEISALFDQIAYAKSGSVIRMTENFLTTNVFKKGLHDYLTEMGTKSATPDDLYRNLQKAAEQASPAILPTNLTVSKILKTWDSAKGFPLVKVERNYAEDSSQKVTLTQSRFLIGEPTNETAAPWIIPINYATKSSQNFDKVTADTWLTKPTETGTVAGLTNDQWLIVNKQQTGYYRVTYDEKNWDLIAEALIADHSKIHVLNRAQLIDDSFNLAREGRLSYEIPLKLSSYLKKETDYIPMVSFYAAASYLTEVLPESPAYKDFKGHILGLLDGAYKKLGFDEKPDDSHTDKLNRPYVLNWLCWMGDAECRNKAAEKFKQWKDNTTNIIPLNLQQSTFCAAMRTASKTDWDFLFQEYEKIRITRDKTLAGRMLTGLGCTEDVAIIENFLDKTTARNSGTYVGTAFAVIYSSSSIGLDTSFKYLSKHFFSIYTHTSPYQMQIILNGFGSYMTTEEQLAKLKSLSEIYEYPNLFTKSISNAEDNLKWRTQHLPVISNWLGKGSAGSSQVCTSVLILTLCLSFARHFF